MKKFLSVVITSLFLTQVSFAQSMLSLNDYISKNSNWTKDPISLVYVFKRCGAVYFYASAITGKNDKLKKDLENASSFALKFAYDVLVEEKNMSSTEATEIVYNALDKIISKYSNDGNDSYASSGEYTIGNYIGKDLKLCQGLIEAVN